MHTAELRGRDGTTHRARGFSLVELMIALVVIVILVSLALPSYTNYVIRNSRQQAETLLLSLAGLEEKIFLNSGAYAVGPGKVAAAYDGSVSGGLGLGTDKSPDGRYSVAVTGTTTTYLLTASPISTGPQAGDGDITLDDAGSRRWNGKPW